MYQIMYQIRPTLRLQKRGILLGLMASAIIQVIEVSIWGGSIYGFLLTVALYQFITILV